ncbi:PREDICTED: tripartite motif-containing protein 3-like [Branchiostoma belcheri]|uniref:RING-type E3 ubiquitin transferase n=1 Tax=Branchiostoma belcheri TaxID=7741 RepID=A0A6P5A8T5_BRABE|nr:PREDICTED: tripartite motif-containing protein 3-like [Branchiostoma belcheri]
MAAMSQSLGEQIHEELSCSICLELFTRPKVLPCQHTFCQDCLQDHVEVRTPLECPNCRQPFSLPPGGVPALPDNHLVASLCGRIIKQSFPSSIDKKRQPTSSEQCSFHPGEQLSLYCEECTVQLCMTCLDEAHRGHSTMSLKRASQERRASVQTLIGEGRDVIETYCGLLRDLRDKEKFLTDQKTLTESSIHVAFNQTVQMLTENRNGLLAKVEQRYTLNMETIQGQRDDILSTVSEISAACDNAEVTMQQKGRTSFDQEIGLKRLVGKYKGRAGQHPTEAKVAVFQTVEVKVPPLGFVTVQSISLPDSQGVSKDPPRTQSVKFGGRGSDQGKFDRPHGVTVSKDGLVFVSDYGNERIQCFNLQGTFLHQFPTVVSVQGVFKSLVTAKQRMKPEDLSMDRDGNLWVVGSDNSAEYAVQYSPRGKLLTKIDLKRTGRQRKIAIDTIRNNVIITETSGSMSPQGVLCVYRPDGTLERTLGGQHKMARPEYISVNKGGHIFVSHFMASCVYVFREDGHMLSVFGGEGSREGELKYPGGICTDSSGNIIVADKGNKNVAVFDRTGNFLRYITSVEGRPVAVAMAPKGQLVVTDDIHNTVTILYSY